MKVHWRPRRPTIAVVDIRYSDEATSLTISAIERVLKYQVVFLPSIL
jgi:hypothetical protein